MPPVTHLKTMLPGDVFYAPRQFRRYGKVCSHAARAVVLLVNLGSRRVRARAGILQPRWFTAEEVALWSRGEPGPERLLLWERSARVGQRARRTRNGLQHSAAQ